MKFYDTCSLLKMSVEKLSQEHFGLSSITLNELERIKTATNKDPDIKYRARKLLHYLNENENNYTIFIFEPSMLNGIEYEVTDDLKILVTAYAYQTALSQFTTEDLALKAIAKTMLEIPVVSLGDQEEDDDYCGYTETQLDDECMANFYSDMDYNHFDLCENEYLVIKDKYGSIVDLLCWDGETHRHIKYPNYNSDMFGFIQPIKGDIYQKMALDSLAHNQITMLRGPAGSGKSYLAMGYLMSQLEHGKIDKIIIFCNTIAAKNAVKMGFYPGDRNAKLLDSQIGNMLISKLGDRIIVEEMIDKGELVLLPFSDIRGYDTSGMNAGIYITEAQNLDIELMRLALQRIGEDGICIIDGDNNGQVDDISFAGDNNGMRRVSKVFRDHDVYGEVELKQIHRSKIAMIAQEM